MKNKNDQSRKVELANFWFWADGNTAVSHSAGVLLITQEMWEKSSDDIRAKFRPVDANNGLIGYGLVLKDILFVLLD